MEKKEGKIKIGKLRRHSKGFGFVLQDPQEGDIFIPPSNMGTAMDGDEVVVRLIKDSGIQSREGEIIEVKSRSVTRLVGNITKLRGKYYVIPDRKNLDLVYISKKNIDEAVKGDKVVAEIIKYPGKTVDAEARIVEVLGSSYEPEVRLKGLLKQYGIPEEFTEEVKDEAYKTATSSSNKDNSGSSGGISEKEFKIRKDLRGKTIITIDGADAKDLDDAVSIEISGNGNFILGVHIADVSHYVSEDTELDKEAMRRGCSVYLIDYVVPMLPEIISNGVCSLNPNEDRLTLTVEMEIDRDGKVVGHNIFESIIHSKVRMVYTDLSDILEFGDKTQIEKYREIYTDLLNMAELAKRLNSARMKRGSIDFDLDESWIVLGENGIPDSVGIAERRTANKLIEEFMLIANETIAGHFFNLRVPFVYRTHEKPSGDKMIEFKMFLATLGYTLKGKPENLHPNALREVLEAAEMKPEENIINRVMIRAMKKAYYGTECLGHFALGVKYYCHFTSPIRRYPDLMIHRIIKEVIKDGVLNDERERKLFDHAGEASLQASVAERNSIEIEREYQKIKITEYMTRHIGEEYEGIISGVMNSGFFVELANTVEGFVKISSLRDDYYTFEPKSYRLVGESKRKVYSLGQFVNVLVENADMKTAEIEFSLINKDKRPKTNDNTGNRNIVRKDKKRKKRKE